MDIIRLAIARPVVSLVGIILLVLFGTLSLVGMPYQLSPTVSQPEITVRTVWPGATPFEVERDVIEEQEEVLKGLPGLDEMESTSRNDVGEITLTFDIETPILEALLRTSNKLDEVPDYPDNVERPIINASGANSSPVIWMIMKERARTDEGESAGEVNPYLFRTYFEDEISQYFERIDGVEDLFVVGGVEKEMHVVIDPRRMAAFNITPNMLIDALQSHNVNVSGGDMHMGRRAYRVRTLGEYKNADEIMQTVIVAEGDRFVRVADVAEARPGYNKFREAMFHMGDPGIAIGVRPQVGVNVLTLTDEAERVTAEVNERYLKDKGLELVWGYEQRPYINGAIDLVQQNILIGAVLAIIVLLVFLRNVASTLIVGVAIPLSVIGTFIFLEALGRNLNVISLAGISFSVGMLVDNAIVVLENIDRHRSMGKKPFQAAYDGASEVWGAVLASTLTTIAVFLPIVFIQQEAGQLFKDIAIAITCAITLSMIISVTVIPMLANQLFGWRWLQRIPFIGRSDCAEDPDDPECIDHYDKPRPLTVRAGEAVAGGMMGLLRMAERNTVTRMATVALLVGFAVVSSWLLFPKLEYLPQGNRNLLLNIFIPPPGMSYAERFSLGRGVHEQIKHLYGEDEVDGVPGIDHQFYVAGDFITLFGVISTQPQRVRELIPVMTQVVNSFPGYFGVSLQSGIFEQGIGEGRSIDVNVSGRLIEEIAADARTIFMALMGHFQGQAQVQPVPSFELTYPEVRFAPDLERLTANGMSIRDLGVAVDIYNDGRDIGDFKREGEKKITFRLKGDPDTLETPEDLNNALVVTPRGGLVPLDSLSTLVRTSDITEVRHLEQRRTITLRVTPPPGMPVEQALIDIRDKVVQPLQAEGKLDNTDVSYSGTADKLEETWGVLQNNFLLAVVITYLLMSALFGNFLYPFIIMFTVPLAAAGGFIGLKLVNLLIQPQPLDVLTMLGFVMLIGIVVNNAILIVHQALNNMREGGMQPKEAVMDSARTRIRPIYMSATTSILGMLPLVIAPGPGSELYRGLGAVVLGGLAISTIFTIFLIPVLLLALLRVVPYSEVDNEKAA